jgi:hypothetical protein
MTCWYHDPQRRPPIYWGPGDCSTQSTHAERLANSTQRFYCDAHARWRRSDVPTAPVREMHPGESSIA